MLIRIYTSRDLRTGEPLDIPRDAYRFEHPDIPLEVDVIRQDDDWELRARIAEDVPRIDERGNETGGLLFPAGLEIELTGEEESDAIEDYCRSEMGIYD